MHAWKLSLLKKTNEICPTVQKMIELQTIYLQIKLVLKLVNFSRIKLDMLLHLSTFTTDSWPTRNRSTFINLMLELQYHHYLSYEALEHLLSCISITLKQKSSNLPIFPLSTKSFRVSFISWILWALSHSSDV